MSSCENCNLLESGFCVHWRQPVPEEAKAHGCEAFRLWSPEGRFARAKTPGDLVEVTWRIDPASYSEEDLAAMWSAFYDRWKKIAKKGEKIKDFLHLNYKESS